jgi:hypothetical protein
MASKYYAIEVIDGNGWEENCPDWDGVFFGDQLRAEGALGMANRVLVVSGARNRDAIIRELNRSGDWRVEDYDENDNYVCTVERPLYGWRVATDDEIAEVVR